MLHHFLVLPCRENSARVVRCRRQEKGGAESPVFAPFQVKFSAKQTSGALDVPHYANIG
jgi:hypothetical protein